MVMTQGGLGRRVPTDFQHVDKYPIGAALQAKPTTVEKALPLPHWHWTHDQGDEGACEGHGNAMMMAVRNLVQNTEADAATKTVRYDPWWLWDRAKEIDEWPDTAPGDQNGTSGRAVCEVMKTQGLVKVTPVKAVPPYPGTRGTPDLSAGIAAYRWATEVDEMRQCIAAELPIAIGVNWYDNFDTPSQHPDNSWWIGESNLGEMRGGHCVCVYGASDKRQAFRVKNSWGKEYPLVWLPYKTMQRLLDEQGEACIVVDR